MPQCGQPPKWDVVTVVLGLWSDGAGKRMIKALMGYVSFLCLMGYLCPHLVDGGDGKGIPAKIYRVLCPKFPTIDSNLASEAS